MAVIAQEVSYREAGSGEDWTVFRVDDGAPIKITDIVRGITYDVEIRNVDSSGRLSNPASFQHMVETAVREGTLALPVNAFANIPSTWDIDTSVTFNASDTSATISVSAGTLVVGSASVSYGASSVTIPASPGVEKRYFLYYDDLRMEGGTLPLGITESYIESIGGNGRVAIGNVKFTYPAVGQPPITGGGGIGGSGGGNGAYDTVEV